jgi:hypothetical protein
VKSAEGRRKAAAFHAAALDWAADMMGLDHWFGLLKDAGLDTYDVETGLAELIRQRDAALSEVETLKARLVALGDGEDFGEE